MCAVVEQTWSPRDNRSTVRALLVHRLQSGNQPVAPVHPYYQPWSSTPSSSSAVKPAAHPAAGASTEAARPPPACPMHAGGGGAPAEFTKRSAGPSMAAKLNPLNNMPTLSQDRASNQKVDLPTDRVVSSIPRSRDAAAPGASPYDKPADASGCPVPHDQRASFAGGDDASSSAASKDSQSSNWEYPSPQQFYNALVRKGWETPEEHVEMMVMVHNFLNERAWLEVLEWEKSMGVAAKDVSLARFQGRPGTTSPKARLFSWAAMVAPGKFSSEPPFDRHDWVVRRPNEQEVRYVIDYYSAPDDPETDEPVFHLDVRPALDSFEAAQARIRRTWTEWRAQPETGPSSPSS